MPTPRTTASRYPTHRMHYDQSVIYGILDEALFCTVSYSIDNEPFAIPTGFVRVGDYVYIHGSVGSHFLRIIEQGLTVCVSVMLADALVIAKSAFDHSVNYRSVILFGKAEKVEAYEEKVQFLKDLTEKMVPNSWDYLRPMTASEVKKTTVIRVSTQEASAKMRTGWPSQEPDEAELPIWTGLIPIPPHRLAPVTAPESAHIALPAHLLPTTQVASE